MTITATTTRQAPAYHELTILTFGTTMISATSMDDILRHLKGRLPTSHACRTIYSQTKPTYDQAEQIADLPEFSHIEAHINLA
jgi:hypothetical protein